ncbi:MAG TPA: hypothetical protein PK186_02090 [candidate division Zixibacteria bacterium]|mgnify:CR=1 FL=1|nr:hypothetical protein [candidate division Zixibacteria bacterium]MDD4916967.1 hypothetical protein [candidate division Zixibacteria bacterium]MDM7974173.1 hypothetical protein [candidate division Zixibacteria bacterium]HOD67349.1 hypothetical protein [candidate division Zixibacteria bacterium]HPM36326.1 hypothetical protein [candidate division Zixibacteria bacterium]
MSHVVGSRWAALILPAALVVAFSARSEVISYQGRLTDPDGLPIADSLYSMTFSLYADSTGGAPLWQETATVPTYRGLFVHLLGAVSDLPSALFADHSALFLQVTLGGADLAPRTRLAAAPSAMVARQLYLTDAAGGLLGRTVNDSGGAFILYDTAGALGIALRGGRASDSAVVFPDSAINADEILDEPGIVNGISSDIITLSTAEMTDLVTVEITIPYDGLIVLYGKCYAVLSGTTGPNGAQVQIDAVEGGLPIFPYYTQAGLSGFVNTGANYFPAVVTRTYYKEAGTYEFRLEAKATQPSPALAQTWDHVLTALYFPTAYGYTTVSTKTAGGVATPPPGSDSRGSGRLGETIRDDAPLVGDSARTDR